MSPSDFPFPVHGLCGRKILESVAAESPALSIRLLNGSEERSQGYYYMNNDATFDSNLVIILAALLCSLMCALGLSSMVRCALRCNRGLMFESPESAAVRLANTGLKKATVRALPTVVYGLGSRVGAECPICLAEFVEGENVRVLPHCNHGFHVACIDTWLRSHSSCPTCRRNLLVAMAKRSSRDSLPTRRTAESSDTSAASGSSLPPSDADVEAGIVGEHPAS